jgi:glycosyltransferase involved in cell wall biosynthesis
MGSIDATPHIVITPSRNEAGFLPGLIESMTSQKCRPAKWVIVDHNSQDQTQEILMPIQEKYDWISTIKIADESPRRRGGQIARLFNEGLSSIDYKDWHFCSKIDADMILPGDYFCNLIKKFHENPSLGIASGSCYLMRGGKRIIEKVSDGHTRGGLKTYRKACFDQIGGVREVDGWDGIDNIVAQMNGWETDNFLEIQAHHKRATGSFYGSLRGCFEAGRFALSMGYMPIFIVARSLHRSFQRPIFFGGISMIMGYISGIFSRQSPTMRNEEVAFLRKKQRERLLNWWKFR